MKMFTVVLRDRINFALLNDNFNGNLHRADSNSNYKS